MLKMLFGATMLAIGSIAAPASAAELDPAVAAQYTRAHELVDIGQGRRLNLFCMGQGTRTVLFDAGGSDWSVVWGLVQPAIAGQARACSYDRAGLGYSDPSPHRRSAVAIVEDAHQLIAKALKGPVILVGHSLGGFNAKLHAALYPKDVAGLVLVDPAEERSWDRSRAFVRKRFGTALAARAELTDNWFIGTLIDRYRDCAAKAAEAPLDPASTAYRKCTDRPREQLGPAIAAERQRLQVASAYQTAQASEVANSVYGDLPSDAAYVGLFRPGMLGTKPVIVLTHGDYDPSDPLDALSQAQWLRLHAETAALSTRGVHRTVPKTGHYIELDAPEAVIAAIREALRNSRR
jgi:pimeloyl-ACP methyl ester carboxylesterase